MKIILSESQYKRVILKESTEEDTKKWCRSNKHKVLEEIKQLWYDWAKSPKTKTRLIKSLETQSIQGKPGNLNDFLKKGVGKLSPEVYANVTINRVVEAVKNYSSFFILCRLKNEDDYLKRKDPVAYCDGRYITMNCSSSGLTVCWQPSSRLLCLDSPAPKIGSALAQQRLSPTIPSLGRKVQKIGKNHKKILY